MNLTNRLNKFSVNKSIFFYQQVGMSHMNIIDASWLYTMVAVKQVSTYALKLNVSVEYCPPLSTSQEVSTSSSLSTLAILEPSHHTYFLRSSIIFSSLIPLSSLLKLKQYHYTTKRTSLRLSLGRDPSLQEDPFLSIVFLSSSILIHTS